MIPYFEAQIGLALSQPARSQTALQRIIDGDCQSESDFKGMLLAIARVKLAKSLLDTGKKEQARSVLEDFRRDWPAAEDTLILMQQATKLEFQLQ